jgi:D-threo-aldose 1-dehydrogenase
MYGFRTLSSAQVIPGGRDVAEVEANTALMNATIPAAFWEALKARGLLPAGTPTPA